MPKNSTAKPATEHSRDLLAQMTHAPIEGQANRSDSDTEELGWKTARNRGLGNPYS